MRTHSIFDGVIPCARRGRRVSETECADIVIGTESHDDLHVCRTCAHGHVLACTAAGLRLELPPVADTPLPERQAVPPISLKPATVPYTPEESAALIPTASVEPKPKPQKQRSLVKSKRAARPAGSQESQRDALMRLQLEQTFARILPRYPHAKSHGLRFVAMVAQQYGFTGTADDALRVVGAAGLTVISSKKSDAVCVDDALRAFASRGEA